MAEKFSGKVKWFNNERGYGFLTKNDDEDIEYFVHFSSISMEGYKTLKVGQEVSFELTETDKGIQAFNVQPE